MSNISQIPRVNEKIRVREVRLIDKDGKQVGIKPIEEALEYAKSVGLDLVEVSATANPPVCRVMDFGKYKYELNKKNKENRKKQKVITIKEIKIRPKIDEHDFETKIKYTRDFLEEGHKVKVVMVFKGREIMYQDAGKKLLEKFSNMISDQAIVEKNCILEGRNLISLFAPKSSTKNESKKSEKELPSACEPQEKETSN